MPYSDPVKAREYEAVWRNSPAGKAYHRAYYLANKEKHLAANKARREVINENARRRKKYYSTPEARRAYTAKYRAKIGFSELNAREKSNPALRLRRALRSRLRCAMKNGYRNGSAVRDLGCTVEHFVNVHIPSLFIHGMTWENYGCKIGDWNLDHIMPLVAFDLSDRQHFILANHYLNLRPLWHVENMSKGGRF
jgi:hypothetical protein